VIFPIHRPAAGRAQWNALGGLAVLCLTLALWAPCLFGEGSEKIETSIASLKIRGQKPYEKLVLTDLDIVIANDTTRGIPLRRLLTATGLWSKEVGDTLFFRDAQGRDCWLTAAAKVIRCSGETKAVAVRHGVSDVTGQLDFYLAEATIDSIFDVQLQWDESRYEYSGTTQRSYPVWRDNAGARRRKTGGRTSMQMVGVELPEIQPPSGPWKLGDPSIHFIQPSLVMNRMSSGDLLMQKTLEGRGRLAGGRWGVRLRQGNTDFKSQVSLDEFTLTHRLGDFESTVGDVDLGMSDLVFPHLRLTGWELNGLAGLDSSSRDDDRSNFGRTERYLSQTDIRGTAPLGSKVELYVGDRFIDEQKVTEPRGAAGDGIYQFRGINLARDLLNNTRTVVTEPDGKITEHTEEMVGAGSLLQKGQTAVILGVGSRRFTTQDFWALQGRFYGGRVMYGLTPYWSVGVSGAYESLFSLPYLRNSVDTLHVTLTEPFPSSSYHAGVENRVLLFRKHLLTADVAASRTDYDRLYGTKDVRNPAAGDSAVGARVRLNMHVSDALKFQPEVFRFDPGFFDGTNPAVQDRQGYVMAGRVLWGGLSLNAMHGQVQDNIRHRANATRWESWQHVDFNVPRIVPRSTMRIGLDRLNAWQRPSVSSTGTVFDGGPWNIATVGVSSTLLRFVDLLGQVSVGDKLDEGSITDLRRGLALPYSATAFQRGWNVAAGCPLMDNGRLTIGHDASPYRQRSSVTHILRAAGKNHWQWRLDGGYEWDVRKPYFQVQPEYYFESSGFSRVSAMVRYQRNAWMFSVGLQLQPIISFVGGRPWVIPHSRLSPGNGGVKGIVFLDANGNGRQDADEPGVPDIQVLAEGGRHVTTGDHGEFVINATSARRRVRVCLDPRALAATYSATNGAQWAAIEPGTLTPVSLGIVEPGSISGFIYGTDMLDASKSRGLGGVRVIARDSTGATKQESITYIDGSFYLGSLMPGDYVVDVDPVTLAKGYVRGKPTEPLQVRAGSHGKLDWSGITLHVDYDRSVIERDKKK
jgi:hypothetical protein